MSVTATTCAVMGVEPPVAIPLFVALAFVLIICLGLGGVIAAVSVYAMRRIREMSAEIAQLKGEFKAAQERCDQRLANSEKALGEYADLLSQFADAAGYRDIARMLAERAGVSITAGGDANVGGNIVGRDVKTETTVSAQQAAR